MASRYQDISYGEFGGGIDQLSPESRIQEGYVQELVNIDPTPEGSLVKRQGTQLYGTVPVRVNKIEYFRAFPEALEWDDASSYAAGDIVIYAESYYQAIATTTPGQVPSSTPAEWSSYVFKGELCFYLDSSVDVLALKQTPLFAYGRTTDCQAAGDFSDHNTGVYYPRFTTDLRKSAAADASSSLVLEGLSHGQGIYQAPLLALSTSSENLSNEQILADSYAVDTQSADLTVVANSQGEELSTFLVTKSRAAELGVSYVHEEVVEAGVEVGGLISTQSVTIEPEVHSLDNFNILLECYHQSDDGSTFEKIYPQEYTIGADGRVDIKFVNYTKINLVALLYAAPAANVKLLTLEPEGIAQTYTVEEIESAFPYVQAFIEETGGVRRAIVVDSVQIDTILSRAQVFLSNNQAVAVSTSIVWDYSTLVSNKICVEATDPVAEDFHISIPGTEHRLGPLVAMEVRYATNRTNTNNYMVHAFSAQSDATTDDVIIEINNATEKSFNVYGVLKDRSSGEQFRTTLSSRWVATESYAAGDRVFYEGNYYITEVGTSAGETPGVSVNWKLFATWNEIGTYATGDYVEHNSTLYKAIAAVPTVGTFIDAEWQLISFPTTQWTFSPTQPDITLANIELYEVIRNEANVITGYQEQIYDNITINEATGEVTITLQIEDAAGGVERNVELLAIAYEADVRPTDTQVEAGIVGGFVYPGLTSSFPMARIYRTLPAVAGVAVEDYTKWSNTVNYLEGQVVLYQGYYYSADQDNVNRTPTIEPNAYWTRINSYVRKLILSDSVSVDALSATLTVSLDNTLTIPITVTALWDYADYVTEQKCIPVSGTGFIGYVDESPQITLYGLPHSQLYSSSKGKAPGYVTHVDVYRAEAEERAICGLGGNLFAAYESYEVGSELGMSSYYPDLRSRADSSRLGLTNIIIGPAFVSKTGQKNRTAGILASATTQANTLKVVEATYISGNQVKYKLLTPEREIYFQGLPTTFYATSAEYASGSVVHDTSLKIYRSKKPGNLNHSLTDTEWWEYLGQVVTGSDYLTVENMPYSAHNGTFKIIEAALNDTINPVTLAYEEQAITITVENSEGASSDFNLSSIGGRAGIFTDTIPLDAYCKFLPGDRILSSAWGGEQFLTTLSTSSYGDDGAGELRVDGLYREISIPDGLVLVGQRTSRIIPLRTENSVPTTQNLVAGDVLNYSEIARDLRAKYVNPRDDMVIKVLVNLGRAFASVPAEHTTDWMKEGQNILLLDEGVFRGEYEITQIFDQLSFTFATTANNNNELTTTIDTANSKINWAGWQNDIAVGDPLVFVNGTANLPEIDKDTIYFVADSAANTEDSFEITSVRGGQSITFTSLGEQPANIEYSSITNLIGHTVEVDEELAWEDSITSVTTFNVQRRWVPVEAPDSGYEQPKATYYRHFNARGYDDQSFLRSTMVNNTMFLTNGEDAVQRYDGANITRAGLIRWQPHLYLTRDETAPTIVASPTIVDGADLTNLENSIFEVKKGKELLFFVGQEIEYIRTVSAADVTTRGRVVEVYADANDTGYIRVEFDTRDDIEAFSAASGQVLTGVNARYSYYYKLNLIDINGNRIVSAVTGAEDARIAILNSCSIRHLLVRPPFLDNFDFYRLEIEIYRTKKNTIGPYYRVAKLFPEWNRGGDAYIEYIDTNNDLDLLAVNQDPTTALQGQELGQTWTAPLRSKYITSSSNSLVLANIKDWPKITIDVEQNPAATVTINSLANRRWLLRKDNVDNGIDTDNLNRMAFEFLVDETKRKSIDVTTDVSVNNEENLLEITSTAHGLLENDWVYFFYYGTGEPSEIEDVNPRLGGHYQVVDVTEDTFSVSVSNKLLQSIVARQFDATDIDSYITATNKKDVPVWLGIDKLYGTIAGVGQGVLPPLPAVFLRSANALNSAQAACRLDGFKPWVVANAGGEYINSKFVLETPYASESTLEIVLPGFTDFTVIANDVRRVGNEAVQAQARIFPSRLIVSYANFPELFDAPTTPLDTDSLSAIDVNPADGQQITGVIPFFGESAFGSAQKDGVLLVFKTASVYVVNINSKRLGQNAVQKLDTRGLGCTAPYSIAPTQKGVMFANQSGIYRITTSLECQYIGRRTERIWKEKVDTTSLDTTMFGHYYPLGNQYKLSVPYTEDALSYPTKTLVYNTTREYSADGYRDGSWTTYSNIKAIGWANMLNKPLIATPDGRVLTLRLTGESSDYRDLDEPIAAQAILRALDFGSGSVRKAIGTVNIMFKPDVSGDNNPVVESATDLVNLWEPLDLATVSRRKGVGNVSTRVTQQLAVIQFTANRRKGVYFQLRISNDVIDEGLNIASVSLMVKGLSNTAIQQARSTRG